MVLGREMDVLIAGNLANTGYELTNSLRKKNIDAFLLLPKNPKKSEDPKFLYPSLVEDGYPKWIRWFDKDNKNFGINNWKFQIVKEMRKKNYDIIIALTEFPIFTLFSGKPFIVVSTGSDIRELSLEFSLKGFLYRRALKKAKAVLWSEPDKRDILKKLDLIKKSIFLGIPRLSKFHPEIIQKDELKEKLVIFHPSRQDWFHKGNDKFLMAFKKLCEKRNDLYLILVKNGPDYKKALDLLSKIEKKESFRVISQASFEELQYFYNLADVIVDQFKVGSYGMISIEAMMCGKPIIVGLNEKLFQEENIEIPKGMINANSEIEIFEGLKMLAEQRQKVKEFGELNLEFMKKYRDPDMMTNQYIELILKILKK